MAKEGYKRKISAILSADVAGYSRLMENDESATVSTLEAYRETIFNAIEDHRGRVVDSPGDNILSEFASVVDAVQCAVEIQQVIKVKNADLPENRRMRFRVGINLGDVIEEGGRIYGDGVNLAARIEGISDPGNICISGSAYEQIKSKLALGYQDLGKKTVKNITEPIRVYRIPIDSEPLTADSQKTAKPSRLKWLIFFVIAGIVLGVGSILIWNNYLKPSLTQEAVRPSAAERLKEHIDKPTEGDRPDAEFLSDLDKTIEQVETQVREHVKTKLRNAFEGFEDNFGGDRQTNTLIEAAKKDTPAVPMGKPSIAVLPFVNLSPDPDQEYFADGLSEEILNSLCQIPDLTVIARTSSFSFKGTNKKIQEIADELGVDHILEGSVRKAGNALRVTTQLIKTDDASHLWSETYDRDLKDVFKIQEDIANNVADKLELTLEAFNLLGGTKKIDAYEKYLVGRGKYAESDTKSAMEAINAAIDMDPEFALAWAYKGNMHMLETFSGSPTKSIVESDACIEAAQKAIELEPNLADGYITLGSMKMLKSEWLEAEINFRKALELYGELLSGNHSMIIPFYISVGKFKKAHKLLEKMRKNDPLDQNFLAWYYFIYGLLGNRQRADEEYQNRNQTMLKGDSDWHDDAISFVRIGSGDVLTSDEIVSSDPIYDTVKKYIESSKMGLDELRRIYNSDNKLSSANLSRLSIMAAYFGAPEFSLDALKKGARISSDLVPCWVPVMKKVRQLPRFKEFVREIGLVDYWKEYGWPDLCRPVGDDDFVCD